MAYSPLSLGWSFTPPRLRPAFSRFTKRLEEHPDSDGTRRRGEKGTRIPRSGRRRRSPFGRTEELAPHRLPYSLPFYSKREKSTVESVSSRRDLRLDEPAERNKWDPGLTPRNPSGHKSLEARWTRGASSADRLMS